jgi:integrase
MKLTKSRIDTLRPSGAERLFWDNELKGFGLRVSPKGRKTFFVQYRSGGRTRRVKIGAMGPVTPDQARLRARSLLGEVATGDDPAEVRRQRRLTPTVSEICDRFIKEHVEVRLKPKTQTDYKLVIRNAIKPALGAIKISEVTRADVSALHQSHKDRPYQANRILSVLSKLFNLSELWGYRADGSNPCRLVQRFKETRKERFLSDDELARLSQVLTESENSGDISPFVAAAFRMLIITGCRLSEIQFLKWEYVTRTHIVLPDSKTGKRAIPLPDAGKTILDALPCESENPFVFQGQETGKPAINLEKPWRRIRKRAGLDDVRIHDLRHTYASKALAGGMSLYMVGQLLGHTQYQTTMRYAHLADAPVRDAANQVANAFGEVISGASARKPMLHLVPQ